MSSNLLADRAKAKIYTFRQLASDQLPAPETMPARPVLPKIERDPNEIEREAFQQGFDAGERSGLEMAQQKIDAALRRYAAAIAELGQLRQGIAARSETDLVQLALEIAKKLVHREIQIDSKIIITLVRVALEKVTETSRVTVVVNPADLEVLQHHLKEILPENARLELALRPSEDLNRGDFLLDSEAASVDARIASQFAEIEAGLLTAL
jgi:flagellar biosynthesis/type III secretory pathway protein FliH